MKGRRSKLKDTQSIKFFYFDLRPSTYDLLFVDMDLPNTIIGLLYDRREGFFSIEELAAATGRNARAVNRAMAALRQRGMELELSPMSGIRLIRPAALHPYLIERNLGTHRLGKNVICFEEVASTNDVAMDSARQKGADGLVILAEAQRRGRAALGRRWISPRGANILMSVLIVDEQAHLAHEAFTIAAGVATAEGIESSCSLDCQLRWPNDVLLEGRKVAGILVELGKARGSKAVVVGIGVNANASPPPEKVVKPATCLADRLGHAVERIEVIRAILCRLDAWLRRLETGHLEQLHKAWLKRCDMINHRIAVMCGGQRYVGRVLDVSPLEGLILCGDHGQRFHLPAESSSIE